MYAGKKANEIFGAFGLAFEDYTNILHQMYLPAVASWIACTAM